MGENPESVLLSREDLLLRGAIGNLQGGTFAFIMWLSFYLTVPEPLGSLGRLPLAVVAVGTSLGLGMLARTDSESRVPAISRVSLVCFALGFLCFLFPTDLFDRTWSGLITFRPSLLQWAQIGLLLVGLSTLLVGIRRLILWMKIPEWEWQLVWLGRVLPTVGLLFILIRYAPLPLEIQKALTTALWISLILALLWLSFLFRSIKKRIERGGARPISGVFD